MKNIRQDILRLQEDFDSAATSSQRSAMKIGSFCYA